MSRSDNVQDLSPFMNTVPFSRLFIVLGRDNNLEERRIEEAFERFGHIQYIRLVKDMITNNLKGICYVKFDKASSAAKAIEEMNGKTLGNKPLKVMLASEKHGNEDPEMLDEKTRCRIFLVIPKDKTEDDLAIEFKNFGNLHFVKLVKDIDGNSRGCAFIRFHSAYNAALALEGCPIQYKAVYASPKKDRFNQSSELISSGNYYSTGNSFYSSSSSISSIHHPNPMLNSSTLPLEGRKLSIEFTNSLTQDQLYKLFSIAPHLEYLEVQYHTTTTSNGIANAVYSSPEAANYARAKLNGFEYPPNFPLHVICIDSQGNSQSTSPNFLSSGPPIYSSKYSSSQFANIHAYTPEINYDSTVESSIINRVFFTCIPYPPSEKTLKDLFSRFGFLHHLYIVRGKKCGYATFSDSDSVQSTIKHLNEASIDGVKYKVTIADPPPSSKFESESSRDMTERKRPRL